MVLLFWVCSSSLSWSLDIGIVEDAGVTGPPHVTHHGDPLSARWPTCLMVWCGFDTGIVLAECAFAADLQTSKKG